MLTGKCCSGLQEQLFTGSSAYGFLKNFTEKRVGNTMCIRCIDLYVTELCISSYDDYSICLQSENDEM